MKYPFATLLHAITWDLQQSLMTPPVPANVRMDIMERIANLLRVRLHRVENMEHVQFLETHLYANVKWDIPVQPVEHLSVTLGYQPIEDFLTNAVLTAFVLLSPTIGFNVYATKGTMGRRVNLDHVMHLSVTTADLKSSLELDAFATAPIHILVKIVRFLRAIQTIHV